jgi:hypothetical protein
MCQNATITTCDVNAEGLQDVRLIVSQSEVRLDGWEWAMLTKDGNMRANGWANSRLAAQVTAQLAFESWLQRKSAVRAVTWKGRYNWQ